MNRRNINEALGVPENIIVSAVKLYNGIISYLDGLSNIDGQDLYTFDLVGDYRISDMQLNEIHMKLKLHKDVDYDFDLLSMAQETKNVINQYFQIEAKVGEGSITLNIDMIAPEEFNDEELVNYFKNNKRYLVPILAHELKHGYDSYKKPTYNFGKKVDYIVISEGRFANIKPLNDFLYKSYYIHNIENLVRPTELAAEIELDKITPKQFYNFFTKNKIFGTLKKIKDFSYDGLKDELKSYIGVIDDLLESLDESYDSDEEKIDRVLELFFINLLNWKTEKIWKFFYPVQKEDFLFQFIRVPEIDNFINFIYKKLNKYDDDYKSFLINEIKQMNIMGFKMIKKLGKLYELTYGNIVEEKKSIWNWEKYQKIKGRKNKITNKLKTKDELIAELKIRIKNNL